MDKQLLKIYIKAEINRIQHAIDIGMILPVAGLAQIDVLEKLGHVFGGSSSNILWQEYALALPCSLRVSVEH